MEVRARVRVALQPVCDPSLSLPVGLLLRRESKAARAKDYCTSLRAQSRGRRVRSFSARLSRPFGGGPRAPARRRARVYIRRALQVERVAPPMFSPKRLFFVSGKGPASLWSAELGAGAQRRGGGSAWRAAAPLGSAWNSVPSAEFKSTRATNCTQCADLQWDRGKSCKTKEETN